ncbi:right-handed parallel beta-helix repeat-containing protein [Paenibacillus sp. BC26]|uniref:right-handed parallel beta-helix repeat-containing protein n=1 Tax=Paenibacillus sp. BC26 TaxID=1881032 RepID=UPI0008EF9681|nr:right-handed parallel beta-helix repeat-containing protein [Paenibacillus sp. BC26]SFT03208.1 Pectate lyase superfamily protein [Paenibacillus sp. BC26]
MGVTQIYAGPTLPEEGLQQFDVFMDGIIPTYLQSLLATNKDVDLLMVAMEQFSDVYVAAGTPGTPENAAYLRLSNNVAPPSEDGDMLKSVYDVNKDGIVDQAAKLQVARTISLTGDVTGSAAFDGSANTSISSTIPTATSNAKGLLSAADKTKLDGIAAGANNYTHPATHPATMITEDAGHRFVTDAEKADWNSVKGDMMRTVYDADNDGVVDQAEKLQTARAIAINGDVTGTTTFDGSTNVTINAAIPTVTPNSKGLMPAADKAKLDGVAAGANNYTHPATHPATMITEDAAHRFVSDTEKAAWNSVKGDMMRSVYDTDNDGVVDQAEKLQTSRTIAINGDVTGTTTFDGSTNVTINAAIPTVTPNSKGLMPPADKAKLDGVAAGANNYTHPATHPATMITEDATHRFVTDAEKAAWSNSSSDGGLRGNVLNYGAKGDGFTDDTAAFQACLDANNFAYIPTGTYKIKTVYVNRGATVRGEGFSSVIQPYTGATGSIFSLKGDYVLFEKFYIHGGGVNIHAFADFDGARTAWFSRCHFNDLVIYNIGGDAFHLTGRGLDYIVDRIMTDVIGGYGFYGRNLSDSLMTNCHFGTCGKSGVSFDGGNFRIVGTKICMNGKTAPGYAGLEASNTLNVNLSGCEIQQNVYDGVLFTNVYGSSITGTVIDSNNQFGLTGPYAQVRLINSSFNKIDCTMVDGRFKNDTVPYNTPGLNGIVQDDKCCYNKFDINYYPYELVYSNKANHVTAPFTATVNDISSVFKVNNTDYFNFPSTSAVIGSNATIGTGANQGSSANFVIAASSLNGGTQLSFTQTASKTLAANGEYYFNRVALNMAGFTGANSPAGKSRVFIAYDSKVLETLPGGLSVYINISESSTAHPTPITTGQVRIINVNKNSQWMPIAAYKPLSYSREAGFVVNLEVNISCNQTTTLAASDIVASVRNIRVGFY